MAVCSPGQDITVDYLRHMCISNLEDEQILEFLSTSSRELQRFTNSAELTNEATEILIHLVACASRVELQSSRQKVLKLLQTMTESPILNNSGAKLLIMNSSSCKKYHSYQCLLVDFLSILQKLNATIPSAIDTPQKIGLVTLLQKQIKGYDDFKNNQQLLEDIDELQNCLIRKLTERAETARNLNKKETISEDKLKPPDDFRYLSVMPKEDDMLYQTLFLRRNKAKGGYNDLDHYLDVQFRLYREDCIIPLREVYEEFITKDIENQRFRLESGRIYRDVRIQTATSTSLDHGEVFIIQLDDEHRKRIRWNNSKRLIFGSVLLLSFDRFKSLLFALVSDSKPDEMRETGSFKIKIFKTRTNQQIPRETPGILLEATSAYFEAYHHVLTALQSIKEDTLPFHQYIVYCNSSVDMPNYLAIDPDVRFDLRPILSINQAQNELSESSEEDLDDLLVALTKHVQKSAIKEKKIEKPDVEKHMIKVTDKNRWPSAEELGMDESQRAAYISALTKEFVLIQGPPGTGKTYIGLQIAKTLLHNKDKWKITRSYDHDGERLIQKKQCILIVCYTNHALDQFVEGIIGFIPERELNNDIPAVIRIGNQSKNPAVDKYSIKNQRYKVPKRRHAHDVMEAADRTKYDVLTIRAILKIIQGQNSVLFFRQLKPFMLEHHVLNFQKDPLNDWLDWIHVSPKSWFHEVQRKKSQKKRKRKPIKTKTSANSQQPVINIVTEAEYQYSERSLDENVEFNFNANWIGIDVKTQLNQIMIDVQDETCQEILQEEAEVVSSELKSMLTANNFLIEKTKNLWNLSLENRWKLYRHWLRKYVAYLKERLQIEENKFKEIFEDYKKARAELDEEILRQASVIAMTTTGAAKYHEVLMKIGPQITIIEEAAEVPEAHIVTAINPECEHLILIGDHKQLEPKPAVRELATRFNLSISLFERMLNNGLKYDCLQRQHRMRPEISELVRHMYPKLYDNANVLEYENIKGIRQNLFFINHEHQEHYNEDGKSFSNEHEAEYVKELCTYLLKQGYKRNEITILAAYTGQMFLIRSKLPRAHFEGINISVLDNYQGEENEIILLSLVRNNKNGDIGFLRRENRICVALSRAKKGLYIIGNSGTLIKDSKEWRTVIQKIKSNNREDTNHACPRADCGTSFGQALPLYCRNHPEHEGIRAEIPADFARAPEGGCELFCGLRLECGHVCRLRCHPYDKNHVEYECMKMCPNVCKENHKCNKRCHFPKSCECEVIMERTLQCHHTAKLMCHIDPSEHQCLVEVKRSLLCDHNVILKCHINYETYLCREIVTCTRDECGHEYKRVCHDIDFERRYKCEITVDKTLQCGHIEIINCYQNRIGSYFSCKKKCLKQCNNNHICNRVCHFSYECDCNVKINKILPRCDHNILIECSKEVHQLTRCTEQVDFILEICGHHKKLSCSEKHKIETAEPMKRKLYEKHTKCSEIISVDSPLCGHTILVECWKSFEIKEASKNMLECILDMCDLKCSKEVVLNLECGHPITTMCYKKSSYEKHSALMQTMGKAGIECESMVELILECGHTTTVKCFERFRHEENKRRQLISSIFFARRYINITCTAMVDIELTCGHMGQIQCWEKKKQIRNSLYKFDIDCKALVEIRLDQCGHTKMVECYQRHNKVKCYEKSVYTYPKCGHERYFECFQHPDMQKLQLKAEIALRRRGMGRRYNYRDQVECKIPLCEHLMDKQLTCGHTITVKCRMADTAVCNQNCEQILICGHSCTNTCTLCEENITHKECIRKCGKRVFCGHNCNGKTCTQCRPCDKLCSFSCPHDICKLNCRDNCVPCKKSCPWKCPHFQCSKLCSEECDRPLCFEVCENKLTCGHKCPGFCSEPCPVSCKDCNATNFFEGDEGKNTVTIKECGHSFGYIYLDRHMEKTAIDLTSKCPACGLVFNWHPRYNKILKRKKSLTEELKENFQKVTTKYNYTFPLCDSKFVQQFHNYIGSFNTYVQIISYISRDRNNFQIKSLQTSAENILKAMRKTTSKCLQNWIDISDAIFRLYVKWMLQLVTSNEKLLERKFNSKNITQNQEESDSEYSHDIPDDNIDSSSEFIELKTSQPVIKRIKGNDGDTKFEVIDLSAMFEEKNIASLNRESNLMKNGCDGDTSTNQNVKEISHTEVEECLTGLDIVRRIEDTMISNQKSEVKRLFNIMIPFMRNEPHFTEAMQCPQLTSVTVIGVHEKDWKICKQGHLTSTLIHQNCYTCYAASSSKVSGESKEGVLWKTHFQPLTENSESDRYHQGKGGNKMGAQQGRNKRNKSNKNWMSETLDKDTKQTNIQEVRTHVQGSNHPSGNGTLLDYIHTNTVGTNRGNSRGRGRGRGKKNQKTYEVAGSSFQTRPAGYQGYNTDFNSSVGRPQRGNSASNFMQSNFGRSTENRGTSHNGIWQRNTVPHHEQVVSHHDPVAGHNGIWQRNIVPHHDQVAGTYGIHMQQSTIYNEPNENFKPFKGGFGRPKYVPGSSDSHPGRGGRRGRGRRGRRGGRGERN
ncbi:NFX1-type zinc finger-containing protein 1-like [Mytilus californianus]|uniref:NFX1-type zinc finger-containing protein 1-like n=1 Tax=Mytilus californianus TaxID=6549 RepID=UPI0022485784|nr:NFX1-type zinc finger-containing protein 1-like [Mytilus californianus]